MRRNAFVAAVGLMLSLLGTASLAQDSKIIRVIVPFPAGGGTDGLARLIAPKLARELGTTVIVDNKPGASGQIAVSFVKAAPADGTTILFSVDHSLVAVPHLNPKVDYEALRDFVALGQVSKYPMALAVSIAGGNKTLPDFAAWVKANPGKASFGLPVIGGFPSTVGATVARKIGVPILAVPYVGAAPMMQALAGDQIPAGISALPDFMSLHQAGKLRMVAVTGARRAGNLPDVPTFEELGYGGLVATSWYAFFGPKAMPAAAAQRFNRALNVALAEADVKQRISELGHDLAPTTLDEAAAELRSTVAFWAEAAKSPDFVRPTN